MLSVLNVVELFDEPISYGFLNLVVAALSTILIGINIAILEAYKFDFRDAIGGKMMATTVLLCYIALSVLFGDPAEWRMFIAVFGLLLDCFAIFGIWEVAKGRKSMWDNGAEEDDERT